MSSGRFKLVSSESPLRGTLVRAVMFCSSPEAMFVSTPNSLSFSRRFATELSTFTRGDHSALAVKDCGRRSEEHTSELQSRLHLVCRLLLEKKKKKDQHILQLY